MMRRAGVRCVLAMGLVWLSPLWPVLLGGVAAVAQGVTTTNLIGSIRSLFMKGLGTGWVQSTAPGGTISTARTRRLGTLADGGECHLTGSSDGAGSLAFYTGNAPVLGEVMAVNYRTIGRAVGRAVNAASQAALAAAG